ncbi:MAG: hydrogenase expression protein HupH [Alphaproteobacteria bacterium]|nr:hydrogenase expression protein HupH [Alphaproteobacteria bacterium]MCB9929466.1 hydrogenase expression protein HupH [Alphaproteobacteria bacterium]
MKLALVNPNTNADTTAAMLAIARDAAPPAVQVQGFTAAFGAPLIQNPPALGLAAGAVEALAGSLAGFDGVIVSAFGDPGRDRLAAALPAPVVGIAEAGMALAARRSGGRFAVVTTTPDLTESIRETARAYGHGEALVAVRTTRGDAAALMADPPRLQQALAQLIADAVAQDGARAIVIGGGPLALAARRLSGRFAVPIIEPIPAAVAHLCRLLKAPEAENAARPGR